MPDLNSVPPSPHPLHSPRRQSAHQMNPPPPPQPHPHPQPTSSSQSSSINILPSNQDAVRHGHSRSTSVSQPHGAGASSSASPLLTASQAMQNQPPPLTGDSAVGAGPGPLRHPRPLTASELHMQLEKEQEAVVNRLTRELSLLRAAQNASVVSNASSTSASTHDAVGEASLLSGSGFTIPTTRRHHRNSSSASQNPGLQLASSYEARHPVPRPQPVSLSRQSSRSRISRTNSPGPHSTLDPSSYFHNQRVPQASSAAMSSVAATPGSGSFTDQLSPGLMPATSRYEETAFYRNELETAKKENETLKRRIRELERMFHSRRPSGDATRPRSDSVSTTASVSVAPSGGVSIAGPRDSSMQRTERERGMTTQSVASTSGGGVAIGVPEDEVKVGESAASSGLAGQQH